MSPLSENGRTDDDEQAGKARLLESFISDVSTSSGSSPSPTAEVTFFHFRDKKGSIVINLHREKSEDPVPEEQVVDYRKIMREKHKTKATLALVAVFGLIAFMAVFAFMTVREHHDHHMSADGSMSTGLMQMLSGNLTVLGFNETDWAMVNKTVIGDKDLVKGNKIKT